MATIFPTHPAIGETYDSSGIRWRWTGIVWELYTDPAVVFDHVHAYDGAVVSHGTAAMITYDGGDANPA